MMNTNKIQGCESDGIGCGPVISTHRQKILIVDDKRENIIALRQILQELDIEIVEAMNGNQALTATLDHHFAVALLDVAMPEMDGFELAEHLRGDEKTRVIPIVFVTATCLDEQHMFNGYKAGGVDYIVKPFAPDVLLGKVRIFLELDHARQALQQHRDHLVREIAERRLLESQVRKSEAKMRSIVDNIGIGILLISPDMRILELNRQMRGWFPEVILEQTPICYCTLHHQPQNEKCENCPTWMTFQDGNVHEATIRISRPDGMHSYRIISSPIHNEKGEVATTIGMVEDVTDRLCLEEQLLQSQKLEAIGQLAGGVAHDFNNMLSIIIGYSEELLARLPSTDPLRESVGEILRAGQRSAALTRQLLVFSRKQVLQTEVLNFNDIIRNLEKMLERLIGEDIELTTVLAKNLELVEADAHQLEQVIMNLAVNARDAMPRGGRLTIETVNTFLDETHARKHADVTQEEHICLTVSDTGCGMSADTRNQIFDPFFTTKENGKGSGLGLSTVYGIVKQLRGNIWVYSEIGKGTVFKIFLPCAKTAPATHSLTADPIPVPNRTINILLVEDEAGLRRLFQSMLSGLGYQVSTVSNGSEALALFEKMTIGPDLIITDVVMPGMSGRELVDQLRTIQPDIRVLYMSGYTDNMIVHHGIVDSGTPIIQKPFSKRELTEKIAKSLEVENL